MPPPIPTRWTRLEPSSRTPTLDPGLRAEVHDPMWMLGRQWQMGEFEGDDAGSPVYATLRMDCTRLTRYLPGALPRTFFLGTSAAPASVGLPREVPLETLVERDSVRETSDSRPRLAAEAGLHLLRCLSAAGAANRRADVLAHFPLQVATDTPARADPPSQRFVDVVAGRVPDGALVAAILHAIQAGTDPARLPEPLRSKIPEWQTWRAGLSSADQAGVDQATRMWLDWYAALVDEPGAASGDAAWIPPRMEYGATVAAPTPDGEVVLTIGEYQQDGLDWYAFDVLGGGSLTARRDQLTQDDLARESVHRTVIPSPVYFPGMPASRYWEFEDARVDFGSLAPGPQQLAHLLLVEFALVAGDDWFVIPVEVPVGSLCRTRWLVVTDTFGQRSLIPSARQVDGGGSLEPLPWDLFRLSVDVRPVSGGTQPSPDLLLVPPSLGPSLFGTTLEEVVLLRDQLADMAWAIERMVESPVGLPFDRAAAYQRAQVERPPAASTVAGIDPTVKWAYRLSTTVPDYWLPLYPIRPSPQDPAIELRRGGQPLGRILEPGDPLDIRNEEVPREGARITRGYQYARWIDGGTHLWMARAKGPGRGEGSSGLDFDTLEAVAPDLGSPAMQLGVRSTLEVDTVVRSLFGG